MTARGASAWSATLLAACLGSCSRPSEEDALLGRPSSKESLPSIIRRVHRLWNTSPSDPRGAQVLEFIASLNDRLDEASWWTVSAPAVYAWRQHRHNADLRDQLLKADDTLVAGLCEARAVDALVQVIQLANSNPFDAPSINALLTAIVSDPLPPSGFAGSRQEALLAAAIGAGDPRRAREYFTRLAGSADASPANRAAADRFKAAIDLCSPETLASESGIVRIMQEWGVNGADPLGRTALQPALERHVLVHLLAGDPRGSPARVDALLDASLGHPRAAAFWESLIARSVSPPFSLTADVPELLACARLVRACARKLNRPALETSFWKPAELPQSDDAFRAGHRVLALAHEALEAGEFDMAASASSAAESLAGVDSGTTDPRIVAFSARLADARTQFNRAEQAKTTLARTPDFPQAALILGRYLCLERGNWTEGLPYLARGADLVLKGVAAKDLRAPTEWAEQAAVADGWRDAFVYGVQPANGRLLERAEFWYARALATAPPAEHPAIQRRLSTLPPSGRPIDLLPLVDPKIHAVYGTWSRRDGGLISDSADFTRFEIPYHPAPEYDVRVTFARLDGHSDIVFFLTQNGSSFAWTVSGSGAGVRAWASVKNQWDVDPNPTRVGAPGWLENGRVSTCLLEVRRTSLKAVLDGKVLLERKITPGEMELPEWLRLRDPGRLGLGTYRSPTLVRRIQVVEVGSRGRLSP